jgi:CheY-like chemotaxis protein
MEQQAIKSLKGLTALVVDDNHVNRIVACAILKKWDVAVDIAENGQIAVDKVSIKHYDVVLMDIQMPVLDGYDATRAIQALDENHGKNVPILAVTATPDTELIAASGMVDYLVKPLTGDALYQKIACYLK